MVDKESEILFFLYYKYNEILKRINKKCLKNLIDYFTKNVCSMYIYAY